jgi:mycothione reductase
VKRAFSWKACPLDREERRHKTAGILQERKTMNKIHDYDVVVVGSGAGGAIVEKALAQTKKTAWVDKGPFGGTCLNVGCIPSKMMIFPADRIMEIRESWKLGIDADITGVNFKTIMERMRHTIRGDRKDPVDIAGHIPNLDFYLGEASFVSDYTLRIGEKTIRGEKIYLASGARPLIPDIPGLEGSGYLTNETLIELEEKPESLVIIGGGYIACEFAHFFEAMGTTVTILQRGERLVKEEEPEISDLLQRKMSGRMAIHLSTEAVEVEKEDGGILVRGKKTQTGEIRDFQAQRALVAAGRLSNADVLKVANTGVEVNAEGYINVDDFFVTTKSNIWAFGDAIGRKMFRHAANEEADLVWHNSTHGGENRLNFDTIPHAVFSWPQIASVGKTEKEAKDHFDILVGMARYNDVAKGQAMLDTDSFVKVIVEKKTWRLLGCHIIGPYAPILIQEAVNAMASEGTVVPIIRGIHIHPSLSEVMQSAMGHLREPGG